MQDTEIHCGSTAVSKYSNFWWEGRSCNFLLLHRRRAVQVFHLVANGDSMNNAVRGYGCYFTRNLALYHTFCNCTVRLLWERWEQDFRAACRSSVILWHSSERYARFSPCNYWVWIFRESYITTEDWAVISNKHKIVSDAVGSESINLHGFMLQGGEFSH